MKINFIMVIMVIGLSALWAWAGFEICKATHRHRGIDTDPIKFLMPDYPPEGGVDEDITFKIRPIDISDPLR